MRIFSALLIAGMVALVAAASPASAKGKPAKTTTVSKAVPPPASLVPGDDITIVNPDFEDYSGSYYGKKSHLKGWKSKGDVHAGYRVTVDPAGNNDNWFAVFRGTSSKNQLSQTISGLVGEAIYTLSFDLKLVGLTTGNTFSFSLGGETKSIVIDSSFGDNAWHTITTTITAGIGTKLDLVFKATTSTLWDYCGDMIKTAIWLDNVSLTYGNRTGPNVPGPIAGAGLPMLLAGSYLLWRRRKAAVAA